MLFLVTMVWRVFKKQIGIYNPRKHLRGSFFMNILNGLLFLQYKLHHRYLIGLYMGLWIYWNFQSEAKLEQIIAVFTMRCVSCLKFQPTSFINVIIFYYPNLQNVKKLTMPYFKASYFGILSGILNIWVWKTFFKISHWMPNSNWLLFQLLLF